jgi:hypothetical protein
MPKIDARQLKHAIGALRSGDTDCAHFNALQKALVENGTVPLERHMQYWFLYYVWCLASLELGVRVAWVEIAADSYCSVEHHVYPAVLFLTAVEETVQLVETEVAASSGKESHVQDGVKYALNGLLKSK